jgi:filamentous hemagglutinin family protein
MKTNTCWFGGLRVLIAALIALPSASWANPTGGVVASGTANITNSGTTLTVQQLSNLAIINWSDFSIAAGHLTKFVQPSALSAALNRVTGANPSSILGTLQANGRVYLINPNGITVGPTGVINTQSFVASSLGLTNAAFLAGGNLTFSGTSAAGVSNAGQITALGGDVLLIARTVKNTGTLNATSGTAAMAAGSQVVFTTGGSQRVFVQAGSGSGGTGVDQQGAIKAASAELAAAGGNVYALAINSAGPLTVGRVRMTGDRIALAGNTTTSGDQIYTGAVTANNSVILTSNAGALTFNGPVSEGFDLTTNSALNTNFNGAVTVYGRLHSNTTTPAGAVWINGGSVFSGGDQIYNGAVRLGADTTLTSPYGGVIFNSAAVDGPYALVINSGLNTTFQKVVGAAMPLKSLTVNITSPYGHIRPNGGLVRTTGDQIYNGPVYADNDATLTSTAGNITFPKDVHTGFNLTTNSALNTEFDGPVSLGNSLTTNGTVILQGGPVTSGGDQTYNGPILIKSPMTLTSLFGNLKFNGTIGRAPYYQYCGGMCLLTTNSAWNTTFNGGITGVSPTATAHGIFLNGGFILVDGGATFNGPVMLGSDTTIAGDPMGINFNGTVDGPYKLSAGGKGGLTFNGAVGSIIPLAGIYVSAFDFTVRLNGGSIRTVGDQFFGDYAILFGSDNTLTSTKGNINLTSNYGGINGGYNLTTNSYLNTTLSGPIGGFSYYSYSNVPLKSVTANITGPGKINLSASEITTINDQTYNGPIVLGADASLTSQTGRLEFNGTLDGAQNLTTTSSGITDFFRPVGTVTPLQTLAANITGSGSINKHGNSIATTGTQTYNGLVNP